MNKFGYQKEILDLLIKTKPSIESPKETPIVVEVKKNEEKPEEEAKSDDVIHPVSVVHVGLNDIAELSNGQLTKTRYFELLEIDPDDYLDVKLTPDQAKKVSLAIKSMSTGLTASVPLNCTGPSCPFRNSCPYFQANSAPIGRPCPVEKQLILYWTQQYVEEFQVDFRVLTEVRMVSELAEFDIYEMRINKYLAENHPTLLQEVVVGFDDSGQPIANLEISRAFDLKERLKRSRMKVLEALIATRKDKVKIMSEMSQSSSTADKINDLKKKIESLNVEIKGMDYIDGSFTEKK